MPVRVLSSLALAGLLLTLAGVVRAEDFMQRDEFLRLAFARSAPELQTLWLTAEAREAARQTLGVAPAGLRLRYWRNGERTAWILDEIGKERPITIGIAINERRIERVEVLAFRESRGGEIRYPFFTEQFVGMSLGSDGYLTEPVDGITGATMSVRAVDRVARLALWLDARVNS